MIDLDIVIGLLGTTFFLPLIIGTFYSSVTANYLQRIVENYSSGYVAFFLEKALREIELCTQLKFLTFKSSLHCGNENITTITNKIDRPGRCNVRCASIHFNRSSIFTKDKDTLYFVKKSYSKTIEIDLNPPMVS